MPGLGVKMVLCKDVRNGNSWSLLAGDLTPLRTAAGEDVIRVDKQRSPFLVQVIDAMEQRITAARGQTVTTH